MESDLKYTFHMEYDPKSDVIYHLFNDKIIDLYRISIDFENAVIRQKLIALGWTPPDA